MMQLFGGFPQDCFQGYQEGGGEALEPLRLAVYRLHHLLNHQLIFGEGYRSGVLKECRLILGEGGRGGLARC
jgi:fructosamine-3-kinase